MRAITIARDLAQAMAKDAANAQMRKAGRKAWSREDYNLCVATEDRLWPRHLDGFPPKACGCAGCVA